MIPAGLIYLAIVALGVILGSDALRRQIQLRRVHPMQLAPRGYAADWSIVTGIGARHTPSDTPVRQTR